MKAKPVGAVLFLVFAACASSPPADPDLIPVPVYSETETPCDYEVIDRVQIRNPRAPSFEQYVQRIREGLGREGAAVGADAVIAELPSGSGVARRREVGRSQMPSLPPPVEGEAVRFLPGTCGAPGSS